MKDKNNNSKRLSKNEILGGLLRVAYSSNTISNLPDVQQEILYYLTVEKCNAPMIGKIRNTSPQAVRKIIMKLRKQGLINNKNLPNFEVDIGGGSSPPHPPTPLKNLERKYRLHAQAMTIEILSTSKKYMKILESSSGFPIKKNSLQFHRRKLVLYSNTSFFADTVKECFEKSDAYWTQFYRIIENELGVAIIKGAKTNIYQFRCHIADVNNPLAIKVITNKLKYKVIDDLGRVRLIIDNSHGLFEKEAVDKNLCGDDLEKLGAIELDIISKEHYKLSELKEYIDLFKSQYQMQQSNNNENMMMFKAQLQINQTLQQEVIKLKDNERGFKSHI